MLLRVSHRYNIKLLPFVTMFTQPYYDLYVTLAKKGK